MAMCAPPEQRELAQRHCQVLSPHTTALGSAAQPTAGIQQEKDDGDMEIDEAEVLEEAEAVTEFQEGESVEDRSGRVKAARERLITHKQTKMQSKKACKSHLKKHS
jgi:hypothetical protein